jgi:hypothetical protein
MTEAIVPGFHSLVFFNVGAWVKRGSDESMGHVTRGNNLNLEFVHHAAQSGVEDRDTIWQHGTTSTGADSLDVLGSSSCNREQIIFETRNI